MLERFSGATRLYPIVGDPIAQVMAPNGVTRAFEENARDAICVPFHVLSADLPDFFALMRRTRNVDGLIITVPHKFAALAACDEVTDRARFLGSVNTIRRRPDGTWLGDMFDGIGFVSACQDNGCDFAGRRALLVGTGGAGTAIAHATASAGVAELVLADLDVARRDDLVARLVAAGFNVNASQADAEGFDIVLNATPLGMRAGDSLPVDPSVFRTGMFVGDVVTKPAVTPLIAHARAAGCGTSPGSAMFANVRDLMVRFFLEAEPWK